MMKVLILFTLLFSCMAPAAEVPIYCSYKHIKSIKTKVMKSSKNDKARHCSLSCILNLKCSAAEVVTVGFLKEVVDIVGPGSAEEYDFYADVFGVQLVIDKVVSSDDQCIEQCNLYMGIFGKN